MRIDSNANTNNNVVFSYLPSAPASLKPVPSKNFIFNVDNQAPEIIRQEKVGGLRLNIKKMDNDLKISRNQILSPEQLDKLSVKFKNSKKIIFKQKLKEKKISKKISDTTEAQIRFHNNKVFAIYEKNVEKNPDKKITEKMTDCLDDYICYRI